jgi:hypothetical protein
MGGYAIAAGLFGTSPAATGCRISDRLFLQPAAFGAFTSIVSNDQEQLPIRGIHGGSQPGFVTAYTAGAIHGSIANLALSGRYREEEDSFARSLGNTPGPFPMVPLAGSVVSENPGLLEVYESSWTFRTEDAAAAWMAARQQSVIGDPQAARGDASAVGPGVLAVTSLLGPADGRHEHVARFLTRHHATVTEIVFQGGAGVTPGSTASLAKVAFDTVVANCDA